jgi:D-3-phosphoglycerate dehydrogenase / 2-oxoglutarate reductase
MPLDDDDGSPGNALILAIGPVESILRERLCEYGELVEVDTADRGEIERLLPATIAIAARAVAVIDAAVIDAAPRLVVIGRSGVGVDRVDLAAATRRGIPVVITPGAGTRAVAEGALALVLHLVKRLGRFTRLVSEGHWAEREGLLIGDLDRATLGIVGYGRIGRRLADLATVLGMRVLAYDPYASTAVLDPAVTIVELPELLRESDVVSLHAPLTPETQGLIGTEALAQIKPGAVLVNCGRGGLLDLDAAHEALRAGRLSGVGLDVYEPEPPDDHPLFHHPDVVLTPHVTGLSQRARRLTFQQLADGMVDVLSGRRPAHVANPEALEAAQHRARSV